MKQLSSIYRKLLRTGFEHAGSFENASIFLDTVGEKVRICGSTSDFMQLYINVVNNTIDDIKYMCVCDPTANVASRDFMYFGER